MSHNNTNTNADRPKQTCHHCKKPGHYRNQCRLLKKQREQNENTQYTPGNKNSDAKNSMPNNSVNNINHNCYKNSNRAEKKQETVYSCCETCGETNHSTEMLCSSQCSKKATSLEEQTGDRGDIINRTHRTVLPIVSGLEPNILTRNATFSLRNCD